MTNLESKFRWRKDILFSLGIFVLICVFMWAMINTGNTGFSKGGLFCSIVLLVFGRHFYKSQIYYIVVMTVLSGTFLSIWLIYIMSDMVITSSEISYTIKWLLAFLSILVCIFNLYDKRWYRYLMSGVICGVYLLFCLLFWGYYGAEYTLLGADAVLAIMQTNLNEAASYLKEHHPILISAAMICFLFIWIGLVLLSGYKGGLNTLTKKTRILLLLFLVCNIIQVNHIDRVKIVYNNYIGVSEGWKMYEDFKASRDKRSVEFDKNKLIFAKEAGLYVLVVGESTTSRHMSAYGYERETTPWLSEMVREGKALKLDKAYSCHTHTVPALLYALTEKNQYNEKVISACASLLELAKEAGYETIWMSNQVQYGAWDTPIRVIADTASQKKWLNSNIGETTSTNYFDEKLVEALQTISMKEKTLLVVHLMGCHGRYGDRYPEKFALFPEKDGVGTYDNAVYYNDYVMQELWRKISILPQFQGMLYFSDHGEAVEEGLSHNSAKFLPVMAEIPVYMMFSSEYQANYPDKYQAILKNKEKMFTNDLIFDAVLGMMGIYHPDISEPENDIFSLQYNSDETRFKTLYGEKSIVDFAE